jgi:outer membrane lipoprotein
MKPTRRAMFIGIAAMMCMSAWPGCSRYDVIPDRLEQRVEKNVTFEQIQAAPSSEKGALVVLGGEVLSAKRLDEKTRLELLQLPLSDDHIPITDRSRSKGRFYAFDAGKEILDPATLQAGTPVTIVGEVTGAVNGKIGESDYQYPTLLIKDLTKWDKREVRYRYPYYGYPYGGAYWYGARPFLFW